MQRKEHYKWAHPLPTKGFFIPWIEDPLQHAFVKQNTLFRFQ